ncbi:MAG: iron ABC transporter permease [Planctomycetes bacterium]|nr:iron ABC transporter permease [Planctomycetota bacterium]
MTTLAGPAATLSPVRYIASLGLCALMIGVVLFLSPGIGSKIEIASLGNAWRAFASGAGGGDDYAIAFRIRLPRTILALQAGITLSLCGAVFQTLFRNALATPYTLGISSGGALGALIAIRAGFEVAFFGISSVSFCAFGGALAVVGVVFLFTRGTRRLTTNELLLAGVTVGMFCSSMMMLVTYLSNARQTFEIITWMMGSLDPIGNMGNSLSWPLLIPAWAVLILSARALNQYTLGEDLAATRGVNVVALQGVCILFASLATAIVVAFCGPIGFVGLVVPHLTALIVGRDCRVLLPAGAMLGGVFLAVCDWLSQLTMPLAGWLTGRELGGIVLPIGVVTAVLGVPIFLVLLHRRKA